MADVVDAGRDREGVGVVRSATTLRRARDSPYLEVSEDGEHPTVKLVRCPACGEPLADELTGAPSTADHVAEHDPADFGLSPLRGETTDVSAALFEDADELPAGFDAPERDPPEQPGGPLA